MDTSPHGLDFLSLDDDERHLGLLDDLGFLHGWELSVNRHVHIDNNINMHTKIVSEVKVEEINVLLARLRNQGTIFYDWPKAQVDALRNHFRFVRYEPK